MDKKEREERRKKEMVYNDFFNSYIPSSSNSNSDLNNQITQISFDEPEEIEQSVQKPLNEMSDIKTEIIFDDVPAVIGASTIIGKRSSQQDSIIFPDQGSMFVNDKSDFICVLSDGMGGLAGGERASQIATKTLFYEYYSNFRNSEDVSVNEFFSSEANKINDSVLELCDDEGNPIRAGATMISAVVKDKSLYYLNIGDSRIYLIRNGEAIQLTHDQNYLSILLQKVQAGEITSEQAYSHPKREALISYCGIRNLNLIETNKSPLKLKTDDVILLCSDGLYRLVSTNEMVEIVYNNIMDMNLAAYRLTAAATNKNFRGQDNTSVILIKIN